MTALDKQNYSKNKKINKGIIMNEYIAYCGLDCCVGCRIDGVKTPFCDSICPIRKCASARKYETCADCVELDECEKVGMIHKNNSDALKNLKNLK